MAAYNRSSALMEKAIAEIMNPPVSSDITISCKLLSSADPTYTFVPFFVENVYIEQDFDEAWFDHIDLSIRVTPKEYTEIYKRLQSLLVDITFKYQDIDTRSVSKVNLPLTRRYKALLQDPKDLHKEMPAIEQYVDPVLTITFDLIEEQAYDLRHAQFHGIFQNVTPEELIRFATKGFNVDKLFLVPPDNKNRYNQIEIPPSKSFQSFYSYLHKDSGVGLYMEGMTFYFYDKTLYIYPPYTKDCKSLQTLRLYKVRDGSYPDCQSYHKQVDPTTLSVVISSKIQLLDTQYMAAENHGTGVAFTRSTQSIDGFTHTDEKGTHIRRNNGLLVQTKEDATLQKDSKNIRYKTTTNNIFYEASQLAKGYASHLIARWDKAKPLSLVPGQKVIYYYDNGETTMGSSQGVLEGVSYRFSKTARTGVGQMFTCQADLKIRITETKKENQPTEI